MGELVEKMEVSDFENPFPFCPWSSFKVYEKVLRSITVYLSLRSSSYSLELVILLSYFLPCLDTE